MDSSSDDLFDDEEMASGDLTIDETKNDTNDSDYDFDENDSEEASDESQIQDESKEMSTAESEKVRNSRERNKEYSRDSKVSGSEDSEDESKEYIDESLIGRRGAGTKKPSQFNESEYEDVSENETNEVSKVNKEVWNSRRSNNESSKVSEVSESENSEDESHDNVDESVIGRRAPNTANKKRIAVIDSDDSEAELEYERRALSPSTRRSIGIFVGESSDESEIAEEEEEEEEDQENEEETRNEIENESENESHEMINSENQKSEIEEITREISENPRQTLYKPRLSEFETSIQQKISSTISPHARNDPEIRVINDSLDDSVQEIHKSNEIFEVSSSFDSSDIQNIPSKGKIQPKITNLLVKKPESTSTPKAPNRLKETVSRSFFENECRQLEELKQKKETLEKIMPRRFDFPDKGLKLETQLQKLEMSIKDQAKKLENMEVDENKSLKTSIRNQSASSDIQLIDNAEDSVKAVETSTELYSIHELPEIAPIKKPLQEIRSGGGNNLNWNEIEAANNLVQPKYTGKQGMKTFENQKALTEKRLHNIHGSLATQPTEDDLHPTPAALKIELMDHQKHGLAFMLWREKHKPRGGILADDMGLGKTLSMIALIVEKMEDEENEQEKDDDDSDLEESDGWQGRGRRTSYNGGTLVVCPASLLGQWQSEVETRVRRNTVSLYVHHGYNREPKSKYLAREDIVVTTYQIVASEYKTNAALFGVKWNRIILDEAHVIRNHKTNISMACSELRGKYRWALTGTPICNKEMDIYALLRFLRVTPFNDLPTYKRWLEDKRGGGGQRIHALMKTMMLRRTKEQLQEKQTLKLPDKHTHEVEVKLTQTESNVYSKILAYSRNLFTEYLQQKHGNQGMDYMQRSGMDDQKAKFAKMADKFAQVHVAGNVQVHQILTLLLRLRQICDHPGLIHAMLHTEDLDTSSANETHSSLNEIDLIKQLETLELSAAHDEEQAARFAAKLMSPTNPVFDLSTQSSKIKSVLDHFNNHVRESGEKAIFVSQWTSVLRLFEDHLKEAGVRFCKLTGEVAVKNRSEIIEQFNRTGPNAPQVMLLSLTAGGVGLNLTAANHLFMIDPHWNPQLENQAQDRVFRVGQKRVVNLYKFITADSIEARIKLLQQKKMDLANTVLTGAKNMGSKLTMQDLRSLFEV
uniref:Transcription termination factor 2 n=1 Tax=Culicoides sonorensis TaxID=179676 RepID=A0A336MPJ0_CULSO